MSNEKADPRSTKYALEALGGHPGWQMFCARSMEMVRLQMDAKIFDPATSDEERRSLVLARRLHVDQFTPEKLRESMLTQARTEITRADTR